ncbi:PP2C family protein-serine/threonine phosphatase [bacterium]|nr:PP2C family protein-serine/threonine phosphatase [bacterium]HRX50836.1 PP2C family protein-serine/threonine phosphatase [Candidatus Krumholzibacteria bacterium]
MGKKLYRDIEHLLRRIDSNLGTEAMLRASLHAIVIDGADEHGIESGRLYRERETDYELVASEGEYGDEILGKTVSKSYAVVQELEQNRILMIDQDSPGFDAAVEDQFSVHDSAAVLVGENPAYILSFGVRDTDEDGQLHFILESIRTAVGLKLRQSGLESQMRQARRIQMSLLPHQLPEIPGFQMAAVSIPADDVGGDVYDAQPLDGGAVGLTIADASGHGLPAALQARDVMTGLRMGIASEHKINTTISRLNRVIHQSGLVSRFVSVFYGELEETGNLVYVNGGHCPPLLFSTSGRVFELGSSGPVLGPLPEAEFRRSYASIYPGEVLVLFTDGLLERKEAGAPDHEDVAPSEYGLERLIDLVQAHMHEPAQAILETIMGDVTVFGNGRGWEDDVTVMVIRRLTSEEYRPRKELEVIRRDRGRQHQVVREA